MYKPDENGLPEKGVFTDGFQNRSDEIREKLRNRNAKQLCVLLGAIETLRNDHEMSILLETYPDAENNNIAFLSGYIQELIKQKLK